MPGQFLSTSIRTMLRGQSVLLALDRATKKGLSAAGAWVRGVARQSISEKPERSEPGKPPHSPTKRLKNAIVFSVDPVEASVVVGPSASALGTIGGTHERGGTEPPKRRKGKPRFGNWRLEVGGHGPIAFDGERVRFGRIETGDQLRHAMSIVEEYGPAILERELHANAARAASPGRRRYPARPFMGPALLRALPRLPEKIARALSKV